MDYPIITVSEFEQLRDAGTVPIPLTSTPLARPLLPYECGVYRIRNILDGTAYIGCALSVPARLRAHVSSLKNGRHHCDALQRAFDAQGIMAFRVDLLAVCVREVMKDLEFLCIRGSAMPLLNSQGYIKRQVELIATT